MDGSRPPVPGDYLGRLAELIASDRRGEAVRLFMTEGVRVPAIFVATMRFMPAWPKIKSVAHTLPYDTEIMRDRQSGEPLPAGRWDSVKAPTLVIAGGNSPAWMRHGMKQLAGVLPNARQRTLDGQTAAGFGVPDEVVAGLGKTRRSPVRVTINGHTYRSTVAIMGGEYLVGVSAENRQRAGVAAGDEVEIQLELDTAPREVTVPADFAEALAGDAEARRFFESLSYSQKRWFVLGIEDAKTEETRRRRIGKAIARLREGRARR